jgi:Tat protein secretion system quality control protein TatD with DNase activity
VGEALAAVHGLPVEEVALATTRNARALFGIPEAA